MNRAPTKMMPDLRKGAERIVADVIDLDKFFGKTKLSQPDRPSSPTTQNRVEAASEEAEVEACVIAFADAMPIGYETLTDNDLGELVRLATDNERFRAILRKLTIAVAG